MWRNLRWLFARGLLVLYAQSCAPAQLEPRVGAPTGHHWPQADEQCKAQPDLEWCPRGS